MGVLCTLFDCQNEAINCWGEKGEYVLFSCKRCKKEVIYCVKEQRTLPHDEKGMEAMYKMIANDEFSLACQIHSEFVKVERNYPFNYTKQQELFKEIQDKYCLPSTRRPADPVIMLQKGLWIEKSKGEPEPESKPEPEPKPKSNPRKSGRISRPVQGESQFFTNEVQPVKYQFEGEDSENNPKTFEQLERMLKKYVEDEDYEKAAEIRDRINKLK